MNETPVSTLLDELRGRGVEFRLDDSGGLHMSAPRGAVAPELANELRARKQQIMGWLRHEAACPELPTAGSGRNDGEVLSRQQRGLWVANRYDPLSPAYNVPFGLRIEGAFSPTLMALCLRQVQLRHASLRTRFVMIDGEPRQVIDAAPMLDCETLVVDEAGLIQMFDVEASRVFDLERGPLMTTRICRLGPETHVLLLNMHHIVFDGWSQNVLLRELAELYRAGGQDRLAALPFDYPDFSRWDHERAACGDQGSRRANRDFWRAQLAGAPASLDLPADFARPPLLGHRAYSVKWDFEPALEATLRALARTQQTSLHQVMLSAWQLLLFRITGQREIVVGVPSANRAFVELEPLVGYFVNLLPLRVSIDPQASFVDLLGCNRLRLASVTQHEGTPFDQIVEDVNPERVGSQTPIFQNVFTMNPNRDAALDLPHARVKFIDLLPNAPKTDLLMTINDGSSGLAGQLQGNSELFEATTIDRWAAYFIAVLEAVCRHPTRALGTLDLLSPEDLGFLGAHLGMPGTTFDDGFTAIEERFERLAMATPERVAVRCGEVALTYGQLDARAALTTAVLQEAGVMPGDLVGLCLPRTPDLVVGMLAILRAGAAYVPLDPKYPTGRLDDIAADARLSWLLCDADTQACVGLAGIGRIRVDGAPLAPARRPERDRHRLSHVIYTSGSTGRPKGVMVTHANVLALLDWATRAYKPAELTQVLASTSISFDISVFEIWTPLSTGGSIVLVEDATALCWAPHDGLSLINTVPSALRLLVDEAAIPASVRVVNVAGEALSRRLVEDLFAVHPNITLYNLYGPTEDTTYSTWSRIMPGEPGDPPIGRPIEHGHARILDERGEPALIGAIGELFLGGAGVTRGYLHRKDLTGERYREVVSSLGLPRVEYRTGDMVRLRNDGQLAYIGRVDNQVKLRGFRIELSEIEHVLRGLPGIADACAVVTCAAGGDVLVAYLTSTVTPPGERDLETALRRKLPDYMVPARLVWLERLPLNSNGKVDRGNLAKRPLAASPSVTKTPSTPTETAIAAIFTTLLHCEGIGVHDDFFQAGGNSLLAMQMIARVNKAFGVSLGFAEAFSNKTVAALAARVTQADRRAALTLEPVAPSDRVAAALPQQGAWMIATMEGFTTYYNMVTALSIDGALDAAALGRALGRLVARHATLRAQFECDESGLWMRVPGEREIPIAIRSLEGEDESARTAAANDAVEAECTTPFDLLSGPLVRASLLRAAQGPALFILTIHHLVSDAWSNSIIRRELGAMYAEEVGGAPATLPALSIGYTDYAHWHARWHETALYDGQVEFWRATLATASARQADFPTDTGAGVHTPGVMDYMPVPFSQERMASLLSFCTARGNTPYVLFMTALHLAICAYAKLDSFMVYSPVAGRPREELEGVVGLFVNMITVVSDLGQASTLDSLRAQITENVVRAHSHSDVSMMAMMQRIGAAPPAVPSVVLNVVDLPDTGAWHLHGCEVTTMEPTRSGRLGLTGLDVFVEVRPDGMRVDFGTNTALFHAESGARMAALWSDALDSLVDRPQTPVAAWLAGHHQ